MIYEKDISNLFKIFSENEIKLEVRPISERKELVFPDDDNDFHAYRILLLIYKCGVIKNEISDFQIIYGRTKFSFFDFLIRYPIYLRKLIEVKAPKAKKETLKNQLSLSEFERAIEFSSMINYIRGPWDHNYYNIFSYMTSKNLINIQYKRITESGERQFCIILNSKGHELALEIKKKEKDWVNRMEIINELFREDSTNKSIEILIQSIFPELTIGV